MWFTKHDYTKENMWFVKGKYKDEQMLLLIFRNYKDYEYALNIYGTEQLEEWGKVPDNLCKDGATIDDVFKRFVKEVL